MHKIQKTVLAASLATILVSCGNKDNRVTDLQGKVKFETISVTSKVTGRIAELYVVEGQKVKTGDTLAFLDVPEVGAKLLQADGALQAAQAQLEMAYNGATSDQVGQIDGQLEAAKAQLSFAEESFQRVGNMFKDSLIPAQKYDEAKMKLNMAKAQVSALQAKKKEVAGGTRKELIEQAKGQVSRARGARSEVTIAADEKYILAPADMSIETITLHKGELATPGYTLFNGYQTNTLYFRFTVSESKINAYKTGQDLVVVNPYTKQEVAAKVIAIKQLARYADVSTTSPTYGLTEAIYELKLLPLKPESTDNLYINSTVLLK
ncbi:HlyD family secretion protein [Dyadobacter tibetensis]|uniref:HlyD family secretion protein n=1 Tax=Dyadobacter tibetensis TaxID=1211851 RepID=UPI0004B84C4C|nr:biotin/lipoyl-binding protein [Dyadobacter tibetensis]